MDADVSQTPRHCVTGTGRTITLECSQTMGHDKVYWYHQDPGMELQLMHYSYDVNSTEKGELPSESTVSRIRKEHFSLRLVSTSPSHTSWYLCASSHTALHGHLQPAHKGQSQRWASSTIINLNYRSHCESSQTPQPWGASVVCASMSRKLTRISHSLWSWGKLSPQLGLTSLLYLTTVSSWGLHSCVPQDRCDIIWQLAICRKAC